MDCISEIDRGGSCWECDHTSLGREDEDFGSPQVVAESVKELIDIRGLLLQFMELFEPKDLGVARTGIVPAREGRVLVLPVRGNTELGT